MIGPVTRQVEYSCDEPKPGRLGQVDELRLAASSACRKPPRTRLLGR
jgi:hypothetical protein